MNIRRKRNSAVHLRRAGFTLVECAVTMALLSILLAAAVRGFNGYHRKLLWKNQNEMARILYLAAQTELTRRSQSGQLSELELLFEKDEPVDPEGRIYALEARGGLQKEDDGFEGDYIRYIDGELTGKDLEEQRIKALYELIDGYLPDKTVLMEGTVRVELDPSEGLVYAVFYSCHCPEGIPEEPDEEVRREALIGYYGIQSLSRSAHGKGEKPAIRSLRLQNRKGLQVSWQIDADDMTAWNHLTYEIILYASPAPESGTGAEEDEEGDFWDWLEESDRKFEEDWDDGPLSDEAEAEEEAQDEPTAVCIIFLNPDESSASDGWIHKDGGRGIPRRLTALNSGTGRQVIQALVIRDGSREWYDFPVFLDVSRYRITLVLDGLDSMDEGYRESSRSDSSAREASWFFYREHALADEWESDFRERVSCTVIGYGSDYVNTAMKESNTVMYRCFGEAEDEFETEEEE